VCLLSALVPRAAAQQPAAGPQDKVAAVKQNLQTSMAALRHYQWVETEVISVKGEEKSRQEYTCYYGEDGKVQKVPVGGNADSSGKDPRGLRGKIADHKKEDISQSAQEAVALIKQYVPPDPAKIQAAKDAGHVTLSPPDAQGTLKIAIADYLKAGDSLTLAVNAATNQIAGVTVSTFTDTDKHAVGLNVGFGTFPDGTVYPSSVDLGVKQENLKVNIQNTGYEKKGS